MNVQRSQRDILRDALVPASLVARPERFGGTPHGDCLRGDLVFENGRAVRLVPGQPAGQPRMVLPRLTEAHVHLDKCHTIDRLAASGGGLQAAIDAQAADRQTWTAEDIRRRAGRGLAELARAGCGAVRTHVDWGGTTARDGVPLAWQVLREMAADAPAGMVVQLAALTGIEDLADPARAETIARTIAADGGVLGSFVLGQPEAPEGIAQAFRLAGKFDLALDFHVDEGLDPGLNGLEMIADTALATGHGGSVLCGHACSLANLGRGDFDRLADKVARAAISVVSLPATNLYLQGRNGGTPDRRGLTRLHELRAAGVNLVLGTDNVRDAFFPLGRHDPIQSLALAVAAAHLDPPFGPHLQMITTAARTALGLPQVTVDGAGPDDLIVCAAPSTPDLLAGDQARLPLSKALEETLA